MSWRIALQEPVEVSSEPPSGVPLRLRYGGRNLGDSASPGHWDHVAIADSADVVRYEDWHRQGALAAGDCYSVVLDVRVRLEDGSYLVRLTLGGGGDSPTRLSVPLQVRARLRHDGEANLASYRFEGTID